MKNLIDVNRYKTRIAIFPTLSFERPIIYKNIYRQINK